MIAWKSHPIPVCLRGKYFKCAIVFTKEEWPSMLDRRRGSTRMQLVSSGTQSLPRYIFICIALVAHIPAFAETPHKLFDTILLCLAFLTPHSFASSFQIPLDNTFSPFFPGAFLCLPLSLQLSSPHLLAPLFHSLFLFFFSPCFHIPTRLSLPWPAPHSRLTGALFSVCVLAGGSD